jgi:hypothetical protein
MEVKNNGIKKKIKRPAIPKILKIIPTAAICIISFLSLFLNLIRARKPVMKPGMPRINPHNRRNKPQDAQSIA